MPRLLDHLGPVYAVLAFIDPALPRALFVALVFTAVLAWRKWSPDTWRAYSRLIPVSDEQTSRFTSALRKAWQALPSVVISALAGALGTGGDVMATLKVALLGLLPPVIHELGWRYTGSLGDDKPLEPPTLPPASRDHIVLKRDDDETAPLLIRGLAALAVGLVLLAGCGTSSWQAQRDASNAVAHVANDTVKPALVAAYRATGLMVVRAQPDQESAAAALSAHQLRWRRVWEAWEAFELAHRAWQNQIDAKGDPLPAAMAAREAYCEARRLVVDWSIALPDFPLATCGGGK